MSPFELIPALMQQTSASLRQSLDVYWPSDAEGRNDPCERNVSMHFAHVLLSSGFSVFSEAHYPKAATGAKRIDILGIAPNEEWYLASEFKKHFGDAGMGRSADDVTRVCAFRLNPDFREHVVGFQRIATVQKCLAGVGVLGGLRWADDRGPPTIESLESTPFGKTVMQRHGRVGQPILVRSNDAAGSRGSYYLQYAFVPLPAICVPVASEVGSTRYL